MPKETGEERDAVLQCGCEVERAVFEELVYHYYHFFTESKVDISFFL